MRVLTGNPGSSSVKLVVRRRPIDASTPPHQPLSPELAAGAGGPRDR
ncbi:hypothetical protein H4696_003245 [Amycolatopsis lexingtonensis]|uniref:Uncharacterized protein n=1 Tax=Amycolatopsis lexingtonensis TaxID=218822 RepID=A0ABR9HZ09_9PSEU|nr:hypothetical protein [Amycolatopsis lexingtonensis]MBE1496145.1 hypothetical protein [Amycolatopsis lexingtonensis]